MKIGSLEDWDEDNLNIKIEGIMDQVIEAHRSRKSINAVEESNKHRRIAI